MKKQENIEKLIEEYLDGKLNEVDHQRFEARLRVDQQLKADLELHKEIREGIKMEGEAEKIREKLQQFHQNMGAREPIHLEAEQTGENKLVQPVRKIRTSWKTVAVAATISFLVSVGTIAFYHVSLQPDERVPYQVMKRMIAEELVPIKQKEKNANLDEGATEQQKVLEEISKYGATAFALSEDGLLVTNMHVVKGGREVTVEVRNDSVTEYSASVVATNSDLDLAILKIDDKRFKKLPRLPYLFAKQDALLGENVYTLGFPSDNAVYGEGVISSLRGYEGDTASYQISIPVNPGNSGAPLINEKGEIVGIVTAKHILSDGVSFALRASELVGYVKTLEQDSIIEKVNLPTRNRLIWQKRPEQLKRLEGSVFIVKVVYPKKK